MEEGLTYEQKKEWAGMLYMQHGLSFTEIIQKVGIDESQLRLWMHDGRWEDMKRSLLTIKEEQLNLLYDTLSTVIQKIKEEPENTKLADLAIKYTAAINNLETDTSIGEIVEVAKKFTSWLNRQDPELSKTVTILFDKFIKQQANRNR